jgi:hypothetical protein
VFNNDTSQAYDNQASADPCLESHYRLLQSAVNLIGNISSEPFAITNATNRGSLPAACSMLL